MAGCTQASTRQIARMSGSRSLSENPTCKIIQHAKEHAYAVPGVCVYNLEAVLATIKAAEMERSPVMIQLFPWAIHFYGAEFVAYCRQLARAAS